MSDSEEGVLQIDLDRHERSSPENVKKPKLKRSLEFLKLNQTEAELKYRCIFQNCDVIKNFSDLIKCTKCMHSFKPAILEGKQIHSHPILGVLMCEPCCTYYGNGDFSLDEDGEDKYCRWCGEGGKIFLCSECICGFCPKCIKVHFGKKKLKEIERDDEWKCFICDPTPIWKLRAVCDMAKKQSDLNKCKNDAVENETPNKKKFLRLRNSKQYNVPANSSHETTNNMGGSSNEDSLNSSKGIEGSCAKLFPSKRKRFLASNPREGSIKASSREMSDEEVEPPKKMKPAGSRNTGKTPMGQRRYACNSNNMAFSSTSTSSSSSSDSTDDENETDAPALLELGKKRTHLATRTKNKNVEKLKDIFTVAETVSELCLTMCRKKIRKLDRKFMSDDKLMPECEKLRSMIILMSCSLSTVHNLIVSLQQKWKMKEISSVQFRGNQDSTFLEAMGKLLRTKRIKTSYFFDIASDILNRYPFIELGVKSFNNFLCNSVFIESRLECDANGTCYCPKLNSVRECNEKNDRNGIFKKDLHSSVETVIPDDLNNTDFNTTNNSLEKVTRDDVTGVSSQVLEPDSNHVSSNNEPSGPAPGLRQCDELDTSLQKNSASDGCPDMEKLYLESLKLREQFLLSSSDESSPKDENSVIGGNSSCVGSLSEMKRKAKWQKSIAGVNQLKEEREISRLMDLSSLERRREKKIVGSDSGEGEEDGGSSFEGEESKEVCRESDSSKLILSDVCESSNESQSESPSCHLNLNTNLEDSIESMLENAAIMKSYLLETTSSSDDGSENSNSEKPKKVRSSAKSSSKHHKPDLKKTGKSDWRLDRLLRTSLSFPSPKTNSSTPHPREGSVKNSNNEANTSDSSLSSINVGSVTKRKRKRVFLNSSTSSDDDPSPHLTVESPTKGRRNIKKIVKTGNLQLETKMAVKMENERKKRVAERKAVYEESFPNMLESDRLVLDFDLNTKEILLEVPRELAKKLKPHQKEGIKFMWDCCFESLESLEQSNGSGCVLAHCMGLGKTLQVISLIFTVMKYGIGVKTFLILCPLNVVNNWVDEFKTWLKDLDFDVSVCNLNNFKGDHARCEQLREWKNEGGVMIVTYDLMRNLTSVKKKSRNSAVTSFSEFLLNPGPDLVICDEGHLLKNQGTALSQCIMKMNTSRRIILTGTPLQNNLIEYHSMIQFIKPNILGTKKEFMNRFANPIMNGQFEDSTAKDVKLMRARSHVLHKLLEGCIQRFNYSVLTPYLPEKHEYVLSIRLTESQSKLYQYYIEKCKKTFTSNKATKLFSDFHLLQRIWTHPRLFVSYTAKYEDQLSSDPDESRVDSSSSEASVICLDSDNKSLISSEVNVNELLKPEEYEYIQSSGKLVLLLHILSRCRKVGDKVLVFSQSLSHLNLIEYFLHKIHLANESSSEDFPAQYRDTWEKGIDYYRMEGSTSYEARTKWCKSFNSKKNKRSRLFLISTKAGGLGINLIGANRVVIFDVSWNPSQDVQSIFRVYRFGQLKTCYIYRFVAEGTMEEKIYARQVTKLSLEKRVLDEQQIGRHYTMGNLQALYTYDPMPTEKWKVPLIPKDMILAEIINNKELIASYHEHDSLLENKEEEKLTEEERKAAWEDFEKERFMTENQITTVPNTNNINNATGANPLTTERPQMSNARVMGGAEIFPVEYQRSFYGHMNNPHVGIPFEQCNAYYYRPPARYTYSEKNFK